ncbi:MAG: peptide chain release factor N(5)-glutamine methyltransferase [Arsenophonus sp.]|nr:MAG: peptide chain release factor N(5)-glutamine methyltransferase [Arsenophonus sp.]
MHKKKLKKLNFLLKKRYIGYPISYITKKKEFWSIPIYVSKKTFIPRPETESLVEQSLILINNNKKNKILDLGTGTGAISLALAKELKKSQITGVDISHHAIKIAKYNSRLLKIKNVNFYQSNWFSKISKNSKFNIIVSNPPYISSSNVSLELNDIRFEPKIALISKNNGLKDIEIIINNATFYLKNKGWLLIEHSEFQKKRVQFLFRKYKYKNILSIKDYNNFDRITIGKYQYF